MRQVKVFRLDKWKETPEQFEVRLNEWIGEQGDIRLIQVSEDVHTGGVVFVLQSGGEKKSVEQELCIIAWSDLETLENAVNNALSGLEESGRRGTDINFVTTAKSSRALAAFVVEGNRFDPTSREPEPSNADDHSTKDPQETKQDPAVDAKPKRRGRAKRVD